MLESMVFYQSFHNAASVLPDEQYGQYMRALCDYAFNDVEPVFGELDGIIQMAFEFVRPQIDANKARKKNGVRGGRPKQKAEEPKHEEPIKIEVGVIPDSEPEEPKAPEEKPKTRRFEKPKVEEVREYCAERNNGIDAQHFIDFYEARGWKIGKAPMKDWRAAVRTWEARQNPPDNNNGLPPDRMTL